MANVLHLHGYTKNATVLMRRAEKLSPNEALLQFTLGNMFANLEDYTSAINHYKIGLELQAEFPEASQRLFAVLCQARLHHKLEQQHESLKKTLEELRKFKNKQDQYKERVDRLEERIEKGTQVENNHRFQNRYAKKMPPPPVITLSEQLKLETAEEKREGRERDRQRKQLNKAAKSKSSEPIKTNTFWMVTSDQRVEEVEPLRKNENSWTPKWLEKEWPTVELCDQHVARMPHWKDYPSAYIDPESRGFKVKQLFSDFLGIPNTVGSDQPWRAPKCSNWNNLDEEVAKRRSKEPSEFSYINDFEEVEQRLKSLMDFDLIKMRTSVPMNRRDIYLLRALVDHVNGGRVWTHDLGERILLAYEKARTVDPSKLWLIYNVAGLFWRVDGSNNEALECLIRGYLHAPKQHRDVVLTQLASIMYRFDHVEDSIKMLTESLVLNDKEPVTYYAMGNSLGVEQPAGRGNLTGAIEFYSYALFLKSDFQEPFQCLFVTKCAIKRRELNLPLSDDTVPAGHGSIFWENSWKPELWLQRNYDKPDESEMIEDVVSEINTKKEISEQERIIRQNVRHQKFGRLAKLLQKRYPTDDLSIIEVILEGIDDELNSKMRSVSDISTYMEPADDDPEFKSLSMEDQLKYKIAATFLVQLQNREASGLLEAMEKRSESNPLFNL